LRAVGVLNCPLAEYLFANTLAATGALV